MVVWVSFPLLLSTVHRTDEPQLFYLFHLGRCRDNSANTPHRSVCGQDWHGCMVGQACV